MCSQEAELGFLVPDASWIFCMSTYQQRKTKIPLYTSTGWWYLMSVLQRYERI